MRRPSAETLYYGLSFGLRMPTWVVMAVYLVRTLHLSPLELVLMGTAMEAAVFLFEVPTGVVADTYSRRLSLIVGYLGMGTAWLAVALVSTPSIVIVLWALWGISYTFTSGAEEAWLADEAGPERASGIFLRAARYGQAGAVVGLLLQVAVGAASLRAGVLLGGAFTIAVRARVHRAHGGARLPAPPAGGAPLSAPRDADDCGGRSPVRTSRSRDRAPRDRRGLRRDVERGLRPVEGGPLPPRRRPAGRRPV